MAVKIVGVLGLGLFGYRVAKVLSEYGTEVVAIDNDSDLVQEAGEFCTSAIIGDFTDLDLLRRVGIQNCDVVVIGTGTNLESAVLAVMHARKLEVPNIIAKARSKTFEEVLYEVGATTVVSPERDSGQVVASRILHNRIEEVLRLDDDNSIIEFKIPSDWVGKRVTDLDLRRDYDLNLLGERKAIGERMIPIQLDKPFEEEIYLVGIAHSNTFEKFDYLGYLK